MNEPHPEIRLHEIWLEATRGVETPFEMALAAGARAQGFAAVFQAGYQAAIRAVFPGIPRTGWCAFAVSEDRDPEGLPGLVRDGNVLNGSKTWVAGAAHVRWIAVKAGRGPEAEYRLITLPRADVEIELTPRPRFLPELSQGRAHVRAMAASDAPLLDAARVHAFARLEPALLYAALCSALDADAGLIDDLRAVCAALLDDSSDSAPLTSDRARSDLRAVDTRVQALVDAEVGRFDAWSGDPATDVRLARMYSPGIQKA